MISLTKNKARKCFFGKAGPNLNGVNSIRCTKVKGVLNGKRFASQVDPKTESRCSAHHGLGEEGGRCADAGAQRESSRTAHDALRGTHPEPQQQNSQEPLHDRML